MKTSSFLRKALINLPGWRTARKIIVIESDDWGAVRMPSREVYEKFLSKGIAVDKQYFTKYDCLESNEDISNLFEVLYKHKDMHGNAAVVTANAVVANPDFDRIRENGKSAYCYQLITDTYNSYPAHDKVMQLWIKHGIGENLLWPQFHGREHINVRNWMKAVNSDSFVEELAFTSQTILGIKASQDEVKYKSYMAAFEYDNVEHQKEIETITKEGLEIFESLFGFSSKSFTASCSIQGEHIDKVLKAKGVDFHQLGQQFRPIGNGQIKRVDKFWGQTNAEGQLYWRRNITFEPSKNPSYDWVDHCLREIRAAFMMGKPAVINSHRVNYSGGIFLENRDNSLRLLDELLKKVKSKWPAVEFMNSEQLGNLIKRD